ncbi:O-antigen ligase family protein [Paenibacillus sp. MABNR03]|uniref:O-antigen ligase family protein n=1 Tax=Paenibacillus sp. MABNR03 TaxID=3142626 RepID=UPI003D26B4A3
MQMISLNARSHPFVQVRSEAPSSLFLVSMHILLIYLSIYGLVSIYVDNIVIRTLKDVGMIVVSLFALSKVYRQHTSFLNPFLFVLGSIIVLGSFNLLMGSSVVTLIYGLKITFLPLMMMFTGMLFAKYGGVYAFARTNLIIFILLIAGWLIQYSLGIEKLISMGFVYGVNIKNYLEGVPRLSSITYSPDGYAYTLLITGLIAERTKLAVKYNMFRISIQLLTISFLLLSTIRSALVLWIVYQLVMFFLKIRKFNQKNTLILGFTFMLLPVGVFVGTRMLNAYNLLSVSSLLDRFNSWGSRLTSPLSMHGAVGNGIGSVGAASRRTHMIGLNSNNFAVDNQYFSFYEQTGWIGLIYFVVLFILLAVALVRKTDLLSSSDKLRLPQMATALLAGIAAASLTTNVLEMFPANVFFWIVIGMALVGSRDDYDKPQEAG